MGNTSPLASPRRAPPLSPGNSLPEAGWRRWSAILVLLSSAPAMALMFAALGPALPLVAAHFNGQTMTAKMIMTTPGMGVIAGGLIGGFVIEKIGVRLALFGALLVYALAGAGGLYVGSIAGLLVTRFLLGVAVAHMSNCCLTLLGYWFDETERAKILGLQAGVAGAVAVSMLLAGGTLAQYGGWRAPFLIYLLALPVLALALVAVPRQAAPQTATVKTDWAAISSLWPIYLLVFALFLAYFMTSVQLTFLLNDDGVKSPITRAFVIGAGVASGGVFGGMFGPVYARLGRRGTRRLLIGMMAAGFALIGLTHQLGTIAAGAILCGGGGGMISPYVSGLMLARAKPEMRSRALGYMFMTFYLADFLNPWAVYPAQAAFGIHGAFVGCALLLAIGLAAAWRFGARPKGRAEIAL